MIVRIQRRLYRRLAHHAQRVHLKGRACRCRESFHQECRIPPHQKAAVTQGGVSLRQIGNRRVQSVADLPHGRKALIDQRRFRNARVVGNISERLCARGLFFSLLEHRIYFDVAVRASSAARGSRLRPQTWQRVIVHAAVAHLLSASASRWAIRGVIPIHSTGVPNARMTLPPLAVTAYRSSPSSSVVRAPWVNLPVSPSGMPWARVSAFIAWIVSATFVCCTASLNHRSPWCSSPCIMVSIWSGPRRKCSPSCLVSGLIPAIADLHLCETAVHEQLRSRDIAAVIGREKHHGLGDLIGCTGPTERNNVGHALQVLLARLGGMPS